MAENKKPKVLSLPDIAADFFLDPAKTLQAIVGDAGKYAGEVGGAFGPMGGRFGEMGADGESTDSTGDDILSEFYRAGDHFHAEDFFDPQSIVDEAFRF